MRAKKLRSFLTTLVRSSLFISFLACHTLQADTPQNGFLLDAEAESIFQNWLDQLGKAAGIQGKIYPLFLGSTEVNAAATEGNRILIFHGLLDKCQNVSQLLGVLAHEIGHIQGGHVALNDETKRRAMGPSAAAIILGSAAALASGNAAPLVAGLAGGSEIFMRKVLYFTRIKETASDQAVIAIAHKLKWEAIIKGLYDFLSLLKTSTYTLQPDPFLSSHPLDEERLSAIEKKIPSQVVPPLPAEFEIAFQRVRAKFLAFLLPEQQALERFPPSDTSLPARYARIIIKHRQGKSSEAILELEQLLKEFPRDAYFYELKGQILAETGRTAEALIAYREAVKIQPKSAILKFELAKLLVDQGKDADLNEAIKLLRQLSDYKHDMISCWRLLATAFGKNNQEALASWSLAEEAYFAEEFTKAKMFAERAQKLGIKDSQASSRVRDILLQVNQPKPNKEPVF